VAGAVFEAALGVAPTRRAGLTVYVFGAKGEFEFFLETFPVVDNPTLEGWRTSGLDLVFTGGRGMAVKANPPEAQTDLVVSTLFQQLLADTLATNGALRGWHTEGLARHLAWRLTGTRLSVGVSGRYAGQGGGHEIPGSADPWLAQARAALAKDPAVELHRLLGLGLDAFGTRESLLAYAFSVYLVEGFEGAAAPFARAFEAGSDAERACREALRMPRAVVEHRFARWLGEVAAAKDARAKPPAGTPAK
jgi:hypothetical protein